jgi:DNA-binding NarL/FixJ family response regulator
VSRPAVRLLLADEQPLLRTGFRTMLGAEHGLTVVGEAGDGVQAVELTRRLLPDVVVFDLALPRLDGVGLVRAVVSTGLPVRLLALAADLPSALSSSTASSSTASSAARSSAGRSSAPSSAVAASSAGPSSAASSAVAASSPGAVDEPGIAALRAGAHGLLAKDAPSADLAAAIRALAAGQSVLAPVALHRLLSGPPVEPDPGELPRDYAGLTDREREVLLLVGRGRSNAEIAAELGVGETTVKTHVGRVLTKLGLRDRVAAVVLAYEHGLIPRP